MSSGNDLKLIVVIQFVAETCVFRAALVWMGAADQQPPCCVAGGFRHRGLQSGGKTDWQSWKAQVGSCFSWFPLASCVKVEWDRPLSGYRLEFGNQTGDFSVLFFKGFLIRVISLITTYSCITKKSRNKYKILDYSAFLKKASELTLSTSGSCCIFP